MIRVKPLLILTFVVFLTIPVFADVLLDRVVAIVNQEVITWSELYRSMEEEASPQLKQMKDEEKRRIFSESEASFLETLINQKLQLQEARRLGLSVTDEETNEAISNIRQKYSMSDDSFRKSLAEEGFTFEEYRQRLREQILLSKVVGQQVRTKIIVTEAALQEFIDENKAALDSGEGYRISQILLKAPKTLDERSRVEKRAEEILIGLKDGQSFSELARKYSEDPSSNIGGDLGLIRKKDLLKEFSEMLVNMQPGDVSKSFWTESGLHIIRLDARIGPRDQNEVREESRKNLTNRMFMEKYNAWIKLLREKAYIDIKL